MSEKHPLRLYREAHGLTQEGLGNLIGVKAATISRWEQRKRAPHRDDLLKASAVTGIPAAAMLGVAEAAE
jgi:transcriptional regulator with XRE-family HTH domain